MLRYWGAQVLDLGLLHPKAVKDADRDVRCLLPTPALQDMSAGAGFLAFIQDGTVSVLKLCDGSGKKLSKKQLNEDKVISIECLGDGALLLTYKGKVLVMDVTMVCRPLEFVDGNKHVIQISCGHQHSVALTRDGEVFVWGDNTHGQLGLDGGFCSTDAPQRQYHLGEVPLAQVSAGGDHCFALSLSGMVMGWGRNSVGQLGLGDTTDRHIPTTVSSLCGKKIVFITCGAEHTAALSKGGLVFTFGCGRYGQLGHNSFRDEHHPRLVSELWGSEVSLVECGRHHTLVSVKSQIYLFGDTQGLMKKKKMTVPFPIGLPTDCIRGYKIEKIIPGEKHLFALFSREYTRNLISANSKVSQRREILKLNYRMIERWVSESYSKSWKSVKREVNEIFSTAAALNGSFLDTRCDRHFQTSAKVCGLDFELVKKSFAKLAESERLISEVVKVVQNKLLPPLSPEPLSCEGLRLYLLLPELLRHLQRPQQTLLTEALALQILCLEPAALSVLEMYWLKQPDELLKGLVELFRREPADLIDQIAVKEMDHKKVERMHRCLKVLEILYEVVSSGQRNVSKRDFIIHEIHNLQNLLTVTIDDLNNNHFIHYTGNIKSIQELYIYYNTILNILIPYNFIFNLEAKCRYMRDREIKKCLDLHLRRTALLEDCFSLLKTTSEHDLKGIVRVLYTEDAAYHTAVHLKDFFHNACEELRAPDFKMVRRNEITSMIWFPAKPCKETENYHLFGILCGLAFNNRAVLNLPFPLALFKKLYGVKPTLEDLTEFDPVQGRSFQDILDSDDIEELYISFKVAWDETEVDLDPHVPGKIVTNSNRQDFVEKYVDYILNKSVEGVFEEFKSGFFKACDRKMVVLFEPQELRCLLLGNENFDWDLFKKNTRYKDLYDADHQTIIFFWEVFDELTEREKKAFLLFLTGFEKVTVLGMSDVKMTIRPLLNSTQDHIPQALTCHSILDLPVYLHKKRLKEKLSDALNHKRGFWDDEAEN